MGKLSGIVVSGIAALAVALPGIASAAMEQGGDGPPAQPADAASMLVAPSAPWPVQLVEDGRTFLIYQPQVDTWSNDRMEARSAVSVRDEAGKQNFGVAYFTATTSVDAGKLVTVSGAQVTRVDFPALPDSDRYLAVLRARFAAQSWQIAQDKLQSDMEIDRVARASSKQPFNNDPPAIVFSDRPAVLVPVDGAPVMRASGVTGLSRVVNTRALLLHEAATSRYDLYVAGQWMQAPSLQGPWSAIPASESLDQAKQLAREQDDVELLDDDDEVAGASPAPPPSTIIVSTAPTELLQTDGPAQYAPIENTQLLYVTNSPDKLFLDLRTQQHYALISGRWYRTGALGSGQWNYVPATGLPADFAMIPANHPTESVRAAVPGTPQAREAVIASSVPQMATIARNDAQLEINYDGDPVFQPIAGTSLQNAVNSPIPVIRVSENAFYALSNGVWFVGASPYGPWSVTGTVPAVIYSIPPTSPLYYVTYVRVYDSTPDVVYVGYTPGYIGSYVSPDNVVVYGTGWPYRPWIGSVWYGAPVTWGFGFSFFHSWWHPYPWHYWHRTAWSAPRPFYHPWWGPWHARPVFAGGPRFARPIGPPVRNVGRIYDRWDHRSVVWNGPRAIVNQHRAPLPSIGRPGPGTGFVGRSDGGHWQRLGEDGRRNGRFDGHFSNAPRLPQPRGGQALPSPQAPRNVQAPPVRVPSQEGWRRPHLVDRAEPPRAPGAVPQMRRPDFNRNEQRPRFDARQDRPAPSMPRMQSPQRIPPVAGVPIQRAPAPQVQRPAPQARQFSPPAERIERPAAANANRSFGRPQGGGGGHNGGRPGDGRGDGGGRQR